MQTSMRIADLIKMKVTPFTFHTCYSTPFTFIALVALILLQFLLQKIIHTLKNHILVVRGVLMILSNICDKVFFQKNLADFGLLTNFRENPPS